MSESLSYASEKSGLPPGSLVHVGEVHKHEHKITVIDLQQNNADPAHHQEPLMSCCPTKPPIPSPG